MRKLVPGGLMILLLITACHRVPITDRKQIKLVPESDMIGMATEAYRGFLDTSRVLAANDPRTRRVRFVGNKIAFSVETFLKRHNAKERIEGFKWEFNVVDDKTVNAWCMPGGKVVFYTGILELMPDDTLLAVVMGHEIAHAIARHGNERMSQQMLVYGVAFVAAGFISNPVNRDIFLQSYGIASTLGILKYSRTHESEADKMGLVFMYLAGYNPGKAVHFWERMAQIGGPGPPEFLSTHPSDETRIADIKAYLPEVEKQANKKAPENK
jgi:Zn-dependent protease with chaperone function